MEPISKSVAPMLEMAYLKELRPSRYTWCQRHFLDLYLTNAPQIIKSTSLKLND